MLSGGGYDIITMFHVLEHIPDPKSILGELTEMLADNGQIIVEVPNADDVLLTLYHNEPFSHFTYWSCHLFLYTATTLQMLFDQTNLKVNYIKQVQRYPLSNHLYWLANGRPGGHQNGISLIPRNCTPHTKNSSPRLGNAIRLWQVSQDVEIVVPV